MTVTLQVVGIYYKADITLPNSVDPDAKYTPKGILDLAQDNATPEGNTLAYAFSQTKTGNFVGFIAATFPNNFASPVSGTEYVAGTYGLAQTFTSMNAMTYSVWQYYIFDADGKPVVLAKREAPFDSNDALVIEDNFTLIWRLVTICGATRVATGQNLAAVVPTLNVNARFAKLLGQPSNKVALPKP